MGNTNSNVHERERRKSQGGISYAATIQEGRNFAVHRRDSDPRHERIGGPVDITRPGKSPNSFFSNAGSALSKTVRGFRPRSGTADETSRPRGRANTVSSSQRPDVKRQKSTSANNSRLPDRTSSGNSSSEDTKEAKADKDLAAYLASCKVEDEDGKKLPTIFKYSGNAKDVYVCGSFNNWQRLKMSPSSKDFVAIVDLKEGEHEYKFLVDGKWTCDPNQTIVSKEENGEKTQTNVIRVQKGDFDAYHALDMDSRAVEAAQKNHKKRMYADTFGQEVPEASQPGEHRSGPPILPPHLLQVILNKDTPLSCEPTLLPEPKHVMLNHLYALSIKDGVMVLSSTQRYKRKYVTTLLYKPKGVRKG